MSDFDRRNRVDKFEKRRKNTKAISIFIVVGVILAVVLLSIWVFGGKGKDTEGTNQDINQNDDGQADDSATNNADENNEANDGSTDGDNENTDTSNNENDESENNNSDEEDNSDNDSIPSGDVDTEEIDDPDDENVVKAYTGDWKPVGTSQSEPHEVQYDKGSQDWEEMENAIKYATGLNEMTTQWIGNDGDQKVVGTVVSPDDGTIYRVYLSWQTDEGWQPTKVEILKEVD